MNRHIISENSTVLRALEMLNGLSGSVMTLFVVNAEGMMTGTLTDGDIRRGLIAGVIPSDAVAKLMHRSFRALRGDRIDVEQLRIYRNQGVRLLPRLDSSGRIAEIIDTTMTPTKLPVSAIMMAGGKGERLRPMTLNTPKPLLKIGGKAIIDYNVEALARCGISDIYVTVNYLADKMEEHFSEPVAGVNVCCIREDKPLGTIGSAGLVDLPEAGDTLVMNSDLLTTISFEDMYLRHISEQADITIAAIPYNVSVPYAILATDGPCVTSLEEKPAYAYYANAGIYLISNRLLRTLPTDTRTDATDLIGQAIAQRRKVVYFPISGMWIDVGSPADFQHACELMKHRKSII